MEWNLKFVVLFMTFKKYVTLETIQKEIKNKGIINVGRIRVSGKL